MWVAAPEYALWTGWGVMLVYGLMCVSVWMSVSVCAHVCVKSSGNLRGPVQNELKSCCSLLLSCHGHQTPALTFQTEENFIAKSETWDREARKSCSFVGPHRMSQYWHPGPGIFPHGNSALFFSCGSQAPQPFFCIISGTSQGLSGPTPRIGSWSCALPEQHDAPGNQLDFILCGVTSRIQRYWVEMGEESGPSTPPHSSGSKLKIHLVLL